MSSTDDLLLVESQGHVFTLRLNRPHRHHALNLPLANAIAEAVEVAEADDNIRVIIVTGTGEKAFCAGQDMLEMSGTPRDEQTPEQQQRGSSAGIAIERLASTKIPVIAAINGYCYGGGALLASACDIRLGVEQATFRFPGAEYGLVVGAAWLPRLVGTSKAKELIFTARKFDAAEALDCGFLSHVYQKDELETKALALAEDIAKNSPVALRESKRVIDAATLDRDAEQLEREINQVLRGSDEQTARFKQATTRVTGKPV